MGLKVVVKIAGPTLLTLSLLASGCQQTEPLSLSVVGDDVIAASDKTSHFTESKDSYYINPDWQDDDAPTGPVAHAVSATKSTVGTLVNPLVNVSTHSIQWLSGDRPSQAVRLLEDPSSADNRRIGMNKMVDFGFLHHDTFERRCRQIAEYDTDFTVRATALRTANRARDNKATSLFIKGLNDKSEWVRLESAKGLANVPDVNAAAPLVTVVTDLEENRDVRIAATDALKHYRTLPVVRTLSSLLHDKTFAVAWQAR